MKKYSICKFPSLYGAPMKTNNKILAYTIAVIRKFIYPNLEIRIINKETNEHIVF